MTNCNGLTLVNQLNTFSSVFTKTCFRLQLFIGLVYPYSINLQTTKESFSKPGVEVQAFNPGTQEAEAGKSLYV